MSGTNDVVDCPRCVGNETLHTYQDWKPHEISSGECVRCGYFYYTACEVMSKKRLKELREEYDTNPDDYFLGFSDEELKQVKEFDKDYHVRK